MTHRILKKVLEPVSTKLYDTRAEVFKLWPQEPNPVIVNKVLLKPSYAHSFAHGCFHSARELSRCQRPYGPKILKYLLSGPIPKSLQTPVLGKDREIKY